MGDFVRPPGLSQPEEDLLTYTPGDPLFRLVKQTSEGYFLVPDYPEDMRYGDAVLLATRLNKPQIHKFGEYEIGKGRDCSLDEWIEERDEFWYTVIEVSKWSSLDPVKLGFEFPKEVCYDELVATGKEETQNADVKVGRVQPVRATHREQETSLTPDNKGVPWNVWMRYPDGSVELWREHLPLREADKEATRLNLLVLDAFGRRTDAPRTLQDYLEQEEVPSFEVGVDKSPWGAL